MKCSPLKDDQGFILCLTREQLKARHRVISKAKVHKFRLSFYPAEGICPPNATVWLFCVFSSFWTTVEFYGTEAQVISGFGHSHISDS